eukprot:1164958-Prymnesium_polylepis.1
MSCRAPLVVVVLDAALDGGGRADHGQPREECGASPSVHARVGEAGRKLAPLVVLDAARDESVGRALIVLRVAPWPRVALCGHEDVLVRSQPQGAKRRFQQAGPRVVGYESVGGIRKDEEHVACSRRGAVDEQLDGSAHGGNLHGAPT